MIATSSLDHSGVLGKVSLPLLIPPANPIPTTDKTPRVPTFKYPISPHNLGAWKSQVAVDSYSPTSLAIATTNVILTSLGDSLNSSNITDPTGPMLGERNYILSLATYLQIILEDAMHMATTMFPLKAFTPCKGQSIPHYLWPKSVLHDVYAIRNRIKALRHLASLAAAMPRLTMETISDT
jgi:hypothetical protein